MNDWIDQVPVDDDWLLELLVDNELDGRQRRRLLRYLDGQLDGWKRCALAFLESQSYGNDLGSLASEPIAEPALIRSTRRGRFLKPVALAGSMLLAFALGMAARGGLPGRGDSLRAGAVEEGTTGRTETAGDRSRHDRGQRAGPAGEPSAPQPSPGPVELAASERPEWPTGGAFIPLTDAGPIEEGFPWQPPSIVPPEVVRALERTGLRVERTRGHLMLDLEDDGRIVVPLEETVIVPVGHRVF